MERFNAFEEPAARFALLFRSNFREANQAHGCIVDAEPCHLHQVRQGICDAVYSFARIATLFVSPRAIEIP